MTAAFNKDPDSWKEFIREQTTPTESEESLSQETSSVEEETLVTNLVGRVPCYCRDCDSLYLLRDLTTCLLCGSSKMIPAEVIHYCHPCEEEDQDPRYLNRKQSSGVFEKTYFYIPCQKDVDSDSQKPKNMTGALNSVTCPKCLQAVGVPVGLYGEILLNEN